MYEKTYESSAALASIYMADHNLFFNRHWGAFLLWKYAAYFSRVFHDGTLKPTAADTGVWRWFFPVVGAGGVLYSWLYLSNNYYETFPLTGSPDVAKQVATFPYATVYPSGSNMLLDPGNDILVAFYGTRYLRVYQLSTEAVLRTITLDTNVTSYRDLAWVKDGVVMAANGTTGNVRFVDYFRGEIIETGQIDPFRAASFDHLLQAIATISPDYKMRIYALDAVPALLSNPTATPALAALTASTLRVRLTGGAGEPVPDVWIEWILAGVGGPTLGALKEIVTKTDADGYATNIYYGPATGTGQVKVTCQVDV